MSIYLTAFLEILRSSQNSSSSAKQQKHCTQKQQQKCGPRTQINIKTFTEMPHNI